MRLMNRIIGFTLLMTFACTHEYTSEQEIKESWRVDVSMDIDDPEYWPEGQQIRVGVFDDLNSKTPTENVLINKPEEGETTVSISNVTEGTYTLKLYLTEAGVYKVTIASLGTININSHTQVEVKGIKLLTYDRVQKQVFNSCQLCHGGSSGEVAADLNLTSDYSYVQLVNIQAVKNPQLSRVLPGSATYSYLMKVLEEEIDFDHSASSSATSADRQLIIDWINQGAKNN